MNVYFNSKDIYYRSPFGAVEQDTTIRFRILLPNKLNCYSASFAVRYDDDTDIQLADMQVCGMYNFETQIWECKYTPQKIGLYWYGFKLNTSDGVRYLVPSNNEEKSAVTRSPDAMWQITCYKKGFETPNWPVGGIMYQIFPDRFCYSGEEKNITRTDITYNEWGDIPKWWPNERGEITNTDFFKGDLKGIMQKLDYLKSLGVTCIYLTPVFEAHSNHRYDIGNYEKIDPLLGTNDDFKELCRQANEKGIRIINDGVFSHTGADSVYFNMFKTYGEGGAYNDINSPYHNWYKFNNWPGDYKSWWGYYTLPEVRETEPTYDNYINGENGVIDIWRKIGNSGWRVGIADELPDSFIENLRKSAKRDSDTLVIGEIWEDASNKKSYGARRKFLCGEQFDSVTNYVFRNAILDFLKGADAKEIMARIMNIVENYPRPVLRVLINPLSTSDTRRAITALAGEPVNGRDRHWKANTHLTPSQRMRGIRLMKLAVAMQYTLPGIPCVYYGDEAGMEGYHDPFNRMTYPWGNEEQQLVKWHKNMGELRLECHCLKDGDIIETKANGCFLAYFRRCEKDALLCYFNSGFQDITIDLPADALINGKPLLDTKINGEKLTVPSLGYAFIKFIY